MKVFTATDVRRGIDKIIRSVKKTGRPVGIGTGGTPEVLVVRASSYNPKLSDVTNLNMLGGAFDFLWDEPDLYTDKDIKKRYARKG